jgi:phage terminase large subunit-like protein
MKQVLFALTLVATLATTVAAQDSKVAPPLTARSNPQAASTRPDTEPVVTKSSSNLPFCPPKTCLYYAGDFDSTDSSANGLLNGNDTYGGLVTWVWVGVKPPKAVTVTGVTFNQLFTSGFVGTNPTPFQTMTDITQGHSGTLVCNTSGNATLKQYGESDFGFVQYSYTVKKLTKSCVIAKPSKKAPSTYVNLLPTSASQNGGDGYLVNVEDANPKNHRGWKNDLDDCYFTGGDTQWVTCNSQGTFDALSIALTGRR